MNKKLIRTNTQTSNLVTRIKSLEAIMAHRADLMNHDWQDVYGDDTHHMMLSGRGFKGERLWRGRWTQMQLMEAR